MSTAMGRWRASLGALVVATLVTAGCTRESDENTNEGTNPSPGAVVVEVLVTDSGIEMPEQVPGGEVLFEVTNGGTVEHGFAIDGVDDRLDELAVDELGTLRTELAPGDYTAFSPVEGDREGGLEITFTVSEDSGGEGTTTDEGVGPSEEQAPIDD